MYIGIDLGTSSIKALLVNNKGKIITESTRSYPLDIDSNNWSQQNPVDWYNECLNVIKEVTLHYESKIKGISFSGQMHGLVILDENDKVIRPAILWNDQRTINEVDYLNNDIGVTKLLNETGNIAVTGFTAPKIRWIEKNEPDNFKKIAKIMLPKDYLIYKLSGSFVTEYSDASGTLYFDVKNKKYSNEMLKILNIKESQLPRPMPSYAQCGKLKEDLKKELHLSGDITIMPGGGDQAIGAVGTGTVNDGDINISLGTSGVIFASTSNYQVDNKSFMHSFAHATDGYHMMGVTLAAAGSLQWFKKNFYEKNSYDDIFSDIIMTNINDTVYYLPYLSGERAPINDPLARAAFIGMNNTHNKMHLARALIEGISYSLYDCYLKITALGIEVNKIKITGGGSRNDIWCQMIADIFDEKVETITATEGPAFGAAIVALVGCKEYASIEEACNSIIKTKKIFTPDTNKHKLYRRKYENYIKLYPSLKDFFKDL